MRLTTQLTTTSAMILTLAAAPLYAQDSDAAAKDSPGTDAQAASDGTGDTATTNNSESGMSDDMLVVTVGDKDILGSDVSAAISVLPPQLRQQPPAMIVPMAINQLIARQLILDAAMHENYAEDPEVIALVDEAQSATQEDAMVQVWLDRELGKMVTDAEIQAEYEEIKAGTDQDIPPLHAVRAQIEQQLRQEAFSGIQENLREDVMITYYGPDGKPQTASSETAGQDEK